MKNFKEFVESMDESVKAGDMVVANKRMKTSGHFVFKEGEEYEVKTVDADYVQVGSQKVSWKVFEKYFDMVPN